MRPRGGAGIQSGPMGEAFTLLHAAVRRRAHLSVEDQMAGDPSALHAHAGHVLQAERLLGEGPRLRALRPPESAHTAGVHEQDDGSEAGHGRIPRGDGRGGGEGDQVGGVVPHAGDHAE